MKRHVTDRYTFALAIVLFIPTLAVGQSSLSLLPTTSVAGTVAFSLSLNSPTGSQPAGLQWTLTAPSTRIANLAVTASSALAAAGKAITCGGGLAAYTCVAVGINENAIPNGIVANVTGTLVSGATSGPVTLGYALGALPSASAVSITDVNLPSAPSVTLTPATATLGASQTQAFSAAVDGSSAGVGWTLSPSVGSITSTGLYTAPAVVTSSQTVTVTAALSDGSAQSSAIVTLQPPQVTVTSVTSLPTSIIGGSNISVTVALSAPAPNGGATVSLSGSSPALPSASVTVAAGNTSQTVSLPTTAVTTATTVTLTASSGSSSASSTLTITAPQTGTAAFVKTDSATKGSWKGVYGADGFNVINDTISYPSYVAVTPSANSSYIWTGSTSDPRALQTAFSTSNRIAACWYNSTSFSVDLNFSDTATHTIALYFLDWDSEGRNERIDLVDGNGNVLNTRTVSNFSQGQYLVWNLTGHVVVRISNPVPAGNVVLSGIFFSTVASTTATGTGTAAVTANCVTVPAVQGVAIAPVTIVGSGGAGGPYTFSATGLPTGLAMSGSGTISGTASVSGTFSYTVTVKDSAGNTGTVNCSVTVNAAPTTTCVSIMAVQGAVIAPVTVAGSGGVGGPYAFAATGLPTGLTMSSSGTISGAPSTSGTFSYTVTVKDSAGNAGTVNCSVTVNAAPTAACVGITAVPGVAIAPVTMVGSGGVGGPYTFSATGLPTGLTMSSSGTISGTPSTSGTFSYTVTVKDSAGNAGTVNCSVTLNGSTAATFVKTDTATEGSWMGVYGADGFNVINNAISYPSYVAVTPSGNSSYIWAGSTSDPRALQTASSPTNRIAACWYSPTSFSVDLNFNDTATHTVALYFLDWDSEGRNERIQIVDGNGNVLDTRTLSNFSRGQYLIWTLTGHVVVQIANPLPASNAVLSGIFFGTASSTTASSSGTASSSTGTSTPATTATCVSITAVQGVAIAPVTMVGSGGVGGPYTFAATGLPTGLTMAASGTISGTPSASGTFSYTVTVKDSAGNAGTVNCSVTVNAAPTATCVSITAVQGAVIAPVTMVGSGGVGGPYTFSATGLPIGLTMSASGTISGTPTASGTFSYTVTVKDSAGNAGTANCSVTVNAAPTAACVGIAAVPGVAIAPVTMVGSGGVGGPYTFSATGLPTGLTMSASGTISGTPTASGTFSYTVTVKDSAGNAGTVNCSVTLNGSTAATFVRTDTATEGSWMGVYGADGYNVINNAISYPSYVAVTPSANSSYIWTGSTSDPRALQKGSSTTDRIAACWYSPTVFSVDLQFNDTATHRVALYFLDWEAAGRNERVDLVDVNGNLLDTRTVSNFSQGQYLVWNLTGHVVVRFTNPLPTSNAVLSGIFFGTPALTAAPPTATFLKTDTATEGSWKGIYGADGFNVVNDTISYPSYVAVTPSGNSSYTWASSTSDVRALQKALSPTDRIAACWYASSSFTIDMVFQDAAIHQLTAYFLDWDVAGRNQRVDILDASGNVLSSQTLTAFAAGEYLVWNVSGHIVIRLTNLGTLNTTISGLFFR